MNTKLSGCQLVQVPITMVGENKFPLVENIRNRYIKDIDFHPTNYLPNTPSAGLNTTDNLFITIYDEFGNTQLMRNLPLIRLNYTVTNGIRQVVGAKVSLENCYVLNKDAANVGKVAAFIIWYDLPEFTQRNKTDNLCTDYISVPLTTDTRYNVLPDYDRMTNKRFRRLLVAAPGITPDGQDVVGFNTLANLYLTLRRGSYNVVENLPMLYLYQLYMVQKTEFQNIIFDFANSYITIGGAGLIPQVQTDYIGKYVFLNLQYEK